MRQNNINVIFIDKENMLYGCDDSNVYPLMEGIESLTVNELQAYINKAKEITATILKEIEEENE